jgi:hypothetical protein
VAEDLPEAQGQSRTRARVITFTANVVVLLFGGILALALSIGGMPLQALAVVMNISPRILPDLIDHVNAAAEWTWQTAQFIGGVLLAPLTALQSFLSGGGLIDNVWFFAQTGSSVVQFMGMAFWQAVWMISRLTRSFFELIDPYPYYQYIRKHPSMSRQAISILAQKELSRPFCLRVLAAMGEGDNVPTTYSIMEQNVHKKFPWDRRLQLLQLVIFFVGAVVSGFGVVGLPVGQVVASQLLPSHRQVAQSLEYVVPQDNRSFSNSAIRFLVSLVGRLPFVGL